MEKNSSFLERNCPKSQIMHYAYIINIFLKVMKVEQDLNLAGCLRFETTTVYFGGTLNVQSTMEYFEIYTNLLFYRCLFEKKMYKKILGMRSNSSCKHVAYR